jgi:hypothetical protein
MRPGSIDRHQPSFKAEWVAFAILACLVVGKHRQNDLPFLAENAPEAHRRLHKI